MAAETNLSDLCRGMDIDAIISRLRQVAPVDDSQAADDTTVSGDDGLDQPNRNSMWAYRDNDGRTAFHWAVALKNFELARTLMHAPYNSPVLTEDEEWTTPFATACSVGAPLDFLKQLLERSVAEFAAYVQWKQKVSPPVNAAAAVGANGSVESAAPGIVAPKDDAADSATAAVVNAADATGQTPLLSAAGRGHSNIVRFLVDHGADLNHQNNRGQSALHRAVNRGNMDLVEYLVSTSQKRNGTNKAAFRRFLDLQDSCGNSALFYASMDNNEEMGRLLLRRGADRDLRNKDGKNFWEV